MGASRLRVLQTPSRVEALLESFALDRRYIPLGMRRIIDCNELSLVLQRIARQHQNTPSAWCAWTNERRTLFVAARKVSSRFWELGRPVLRIHFYDEDGRLMSAAAWTQMRGGDWRLCAVVPTVHPTRPAAEVRLVTRRNTARARQQGETMLNNA